MFAECRGQTSLLTSASRASTARRQIQNQVRVTLGQLEHKQLACLLHLRLSELKTYPLAAEAAQVATQEPAAGVLGLHLAPAALVSLVREAEALAGNLCRS